MKKKVFSVLLSAVLLMVLCLTLPFGAASLAAGEDPEKEDFHTFSEIAPLVSGRYYQLTNGSSPENRFLHIAPSGQAWNMDVCAEGLKTSTYTSPYGYYEVTGAGENQWACASRGGTVFTFTLSTDKTSVTQVRVSGSADRPSEWADLRDGAYVPFEHAHSWTGGWEYNETHHWKKCVPEYSFLKCPITENAQKQDYGGHTGMEDGACDTCGYTCLTSLEITAAPYRTVYTEGESFDPSGMTVTAAYADGSTRAVTGYTLEPSGALEMTDTTVTVRYTQFSVTLTAQQAVTVKAAMTGLEITVPPAKTVYAEGTVFDPSGMAVTAVYRDGSTAAVTDYTVSTDPLAAGDTSVTVSYTEGGITKTALQAVAVIPETIHVFSEIAPLVSGRYYQLTGGNIFENRLLHMVPVETDWDIVVYAESLKKATFTSLRGSYKVTGAGENKWACASRAGTVFTFTLSADNTAVTQIQVSGSPDRPSEWADLKNGTYIFFEHTHRWTGGWEYSGTHHWKKCVPEYSFLKCPVTENAQKQDYGAHTGMEDGICDACGYRDPVSLIKIGIAAPPAKTAYFEGEAFDPSGMVVTASFSDGSTRPVTGYTVDPSGALSLTDTSVTVSFTYGDETKTAEQAVTVAPVTLTGIEITEPPARTVYTEGERFDPSGMAVTAVYSNGSRKTVTGYEYTPSGALSVTDTAAEIRYAEKDAVKTARLAIRVDPAGPVVYNIIIGRNQTVCTDAASAVFASDADFSKFVCVEVDGRTVSEKYYTAESGSTVITFGRDYIQTLSPGRHRLTVVSADGSASADFWVSKPLPPTGDSTNAALLLFLLLASSAALLLLRRRKRNG